MGRPCTKDESHAAPFTARVSLGYLIEVKTEGAEEDPGMARNEILPSFFDCNFLGEKKVNIAAFRNRTRRSQSENGVCSVKRKTR